MNRWKTETETEKLKLKLNQSKPFLQFVCDSSGKVWNNGINLIEISFATDRAMKTEQTI